MRRSVPWCKDACTIHRLCAPSLSVSVVDFHFFPRVLPRSTRMRTVAVTAFLESQGNIDWDLESAFSASGFVWGLPQGCAPCICYCRERAMPDLGPLRDLDNNSPYGDDLDVAAVTCQASEK